MDEGTVRFQVDFPISQISEAIGTRKTNFGVALDLKATNTEVPKDEPFSRFTFIDTKC